MSKAWLAIQRSGGLTHEQQFVMTALLRDVDGKPPLTSPPAENKAFRKANPERWERLKQLWRAQQVAEHHPDDPLAIARLQRAVEAAR